MSPSVAVGTTSRRPLRRWVIGLGWLGLGLFLADQLANQYSFETTSQPLLRTFNAARYVLLYLWAVALWLHLEAWVPQWWRQLTAAVGLALLLPYLFFAFLFFCLEDAPWEDSKVLFVTFASSPTPARVVEQYRSTFTTSAVQFRTVKLTPVLGLWQLVEPVDPDRFAETGWMRVNR